MRLLDEQYTRTPFYGTRKMTAWLQTQGYPVDRKRVRRLLRLMGLEAIYTDQGVQFTNAEFTSRLKAADIRISWDGRGRALDNIFVERLWRSVKYEEVYIKEYQSVLDAVSHLRAYFTFYNHERLHQALDYHTPAQIYMSK